MQFDFLNYDRNEAAYQIFTMRVKISYILKNLKLVICY